MYATDPQGQAHTNSVDTHGAKGGFDSPCVSHIQTLTQTRLMTSLLLFLTPAAVAITFILIHKLTQA